DHFAAIDVVIAVHQHLGLDDRNDIFVLTERRITRERVGIRFDAVVARNARADVDDGAPFGKPRAQAAVFRQPLAQPVEPFGDDLARAEGKRLRALVDFDAGYRASTVYQLDERRAVLCFLPDGLVIEDDAGDVFRHGIGRAKQQFAIVAAGVRRRLHADGI